MVEFEKYNIITLSDDSMWVICEDLEKNNTKYLLLALTDEDENILDDSMVVKIIQTPDKKWHIGKLDDNAEDIEAKNQILKKFQDNTLV